VLATAGLVEEVARRGQRLVLASTSSVYGNATRLPTPERARPAPLNPYALSKLAAEEVCRAGARDGADVVLTRLFTVYGPRQRPDMAFARWIAALAEGRPLTWCADPLAARDFTYVGDAVAGLIAALERGRAGVAYNVAGTGPRPLRQALGLIEGLLGRTATVRREASSPAEARVTAACGERSARELGYAARVTLEEGLSRQVASAVRGYAAVSSRSRVRKNSSAASRWSPASSRAA
jgi:nucleoside-diphosphate-sugar epimerase